MKHTKDFSLVIDEILNNLEDNPMAEEAVELNVSGSATSKAKKTQNKVEENKAKVDSAVLSSQDLLTNMSETVITLTKQLSDVAKAHQPTVLLNKQAYEYLCYMADLVPTITGETTEHEKNGIRIGILKALEDGLIEFPNR